MGLHGLLQGLFYLFFVKLQVFEIEMIRKIFGGNRDGVGNLGHYKKFIGSFRPPITPNDRFSYWQHRNFGFYYRSISYRVEVCHVEQLKVIEDKINNKKKF
jgi:hypothetical protein